MTGTGSCPDATGQCYVKFFGPSPKAPNYNVIETDYTSYSVVYFCGRFKTYVWLLAREENVSDELYSYMQSVVADKLPNFDISKLSDRDFQGSQCTYPTASNLFLQ